MLRTGQCAYAWNARRASTCACRGSMVSCTTREPTRRRRGGVAMTRVCLYLRISTDDDHQPTSLGTQRERLERYCQAMESWQVVHSFEDQTSGVTLDRPGLEQALGLARESRFGL